jgi:hypothetical protein
MGTYVHGRLRQNPDLPDGILDYKKSIPSRFDAKLIHDGCNPEELLAKVKCSFFNLDAHGPEVFKGPSLNTIIVIP